MDSPNSDQMSQDSANPEGTEENSQSNDLSQGYVIHLTVKPDGFAVSEAEPLSHEQAEPDAAEPGETYPDLTTALMHLVAEVKANPLGEDSHAQFAAGYSEGPGGQASAGGV